LLYCMGPVLAANVILNHLGHQAIHGTAYRSNHLQHVGTADLTLKRPFNGFDLPADTSNPRQKLTLLADRMGHGSPLFDVVA